MGAKPKVWTPELLTLAKKHVSQSQNLHEAYETFVRASGMTSSQEAFRKAIFSATGKSVSELLSRNVPVKAIAPEASNDVTDAKRFVPLVEIAKRHAKRGGLTLEALCNALDLTPRDARQLLEEAQKAGYHLEVLHEEVTFRNPETSKAEKDAGGSVPELGEWATIGVMSDMHVASKHHEPEAMAEHIRYMIDDCGVTDIMVPGDLVSGGGKYSFLKYEVTCVGIDAQCRELVKAIPYRPGVRYHIIAGNHDESFDVGIDAARYAVRLAHEAGRNDLHYYGARGAMLRLGGLRWEMWHPGGGLSYAMSYKAQRHIDATAPEDRPDILLIGHYHQAIYFQRGGVHAFLCGTFENGDSNFGRMIGGDVAVGSWIIRYALDSQGKLAALSPTFRNYPHTKMRYETAKQ